MNSATAIFVSTQPLWKLWRLLGCIFFSPSQLVSDTANMSRKITRWSTDAGHSLVNHSTDSTIARAHFIKSTRHCSSCSFATVQDSVSQSDTTEIHKVPLCCFVHRVTAIRKNSWKLNFTLFSRSHCHGSRDLTWNKHVYCVGASAMKLLEDELMPCSVPWNE